MVTPVLMIVIPLLAAFLMPLIKKAHRYFTFSILLLNAILSVLLFAKVYNDGAIYETIAGFSPPVGIYLAVDNLSALLALIINLFATINFVTSKKDFKFSMLYLLAVTGATGIVLTGDIFNMFVFFEITAVASYALVASKKDEKAVEGSIK
ncbi:MAG: NADH-quinone oxidoreductase subunit F, partial [Thermoplasmata archaeon]